MALRRPAVALVLIMALIQVVPVPSPAATIPVPPLVITQLTHKSYPTGVSDSITIPGTGYTSSGFTATVVTGDLFTIRIEAPAGKKFVVHTPIGPSAGELWFQIYWAAMGDISSTQSPFTIAFENLQGTAPTNETYSFVAVSDQHRVISVAKRYTFTAGFEFTAIEMTLTAAQFVPPVTETFGPVESNWVPSFVALGETIAASAPIMELVDLAVPAERTTWGALRSLYR